MTTPVVVSALMGYGHLRAARPFAQALHTEVLLAESPLLAEPWEQKIWDAVRWSHEATSKGIALPLLGSSVRAIVDATTMIPPLYPLRDLQSPTFATTVLERLIRRGFGRKLVEYLSERRAPLLTTFYAPAIAAAAHGWEHVYLVVTDMDCNRVWVPAHAQHPRLTYFAPSRRVTRRLRAFGVPKERIIDSGFPLPDSLVGGGELVHLRSNLARRLVRLDPKRRFYARARHELRRFLHETTPEPAVATNEPVHLMFAVGGAGAQAQFVDACLPALAPLLRAGRMRMTLVAGTHTHVRDHFLERCAAHRLEHAPHVRVLYEPTTDRYFDAFDTCLADVDVLWTKPSELTFYGALGLPLILAPPVGVHERKNQRFAREHGVALKQRNPRDLAERLHEWLDDGVLAAAAWAGYLSFPKTGTLTIAEHFAGRDVAV